jgi:hypothetical protein
MVKPGGSSLPGQALGWAISEDVFGNMFRDFLSGLVDVLPERVLNDQDC